TETNRLKVLFSNADGIVIESMHSSNTRHLRRVVVPIALFVEFSGEWKGSAMQKLRSHVMSTGILLTIFVLSSAKAALAYVDPATGSIFIQMLIGGLLTTSWYLRKFWTKAGARLLCLLSSRKRLRSDE